jgi:Methyltransferase domain
MFDGEYKERNAKIVKFILETLGHPMFNGKTVIDLGCGHGMILSAFARLVGSGKCIGVDARKNHLQIVSKTYPHIQTKHIDLDKEWSFRSVDVAIAIDILCRLKNWKPFLQNVCNTAGMLILECAVMDSDDPDAVSNLTENKSVYDASYNGFVSRPSAANIEKVMSECNMEFKRYDSNRLNNGGRIYDWKVGHTNSCDENKRRFWIATKKKDSVSKPVIQLVNNPSYLTAGMTLVSPPPSPAPLPNFIPPTIIGTYAPVDDDLKIACCVSGNLRTFEKVMASFKHFILGGYQKKCDYFIYTWDTVGSKSVPYDAPVAHINTHSKMSEINNAFAPKKLVIESPIASPVREVVMAIQNGAKISRNDFEKFRNGSLIPYAEMLYGWKRSKQLMEEYEKEQSIEYDIVIKLRTDLLFRRPFDIRTVRDDICVPNIGQYYQGAMNDQFAVGSEKGMKVYLSLIDSLLGYLNGRETEFRPEFLLRHHLARNGVKYVESNIDYLIIRPNNETMTPHTVRQAGL